MNAFPQGTGAEKPAMKIVSPQACSDDRNITITIATTALFLQVDVQADVDWLNLKVIKQQVHHHG